MRLPEHIAALLDPASYPERPEKVELHQTHISYLLFTPEFVYKIKKPVDFGFLDFTTLDKRLLYCHEELRLNRRLSEGIYLDVMPITSKDGRFLMGGAGEAVDYAVKMRRLAPETILEEMIKKGSVQKADIEKTAKAIAAFHRKTATNAYISGFGSIDAIRKNTGENFLQTDGHAGKTISISLYEKIRNYTGDFLRTNEGLFAKRVTGGFIRDCHGDIHAEHISITDRIDIIDCIEFNERFRFCDVISDAAFLSMDIDFLGRGDLARAFEDAYFSETGDAEGRGLINFYKCYRAYVRGKVDGFKSLETEVSVAERKAAYISARRHFHLSGLYASGGFRPMMLIVCGLSGTGKSSIARALAKSFNMAVLSTDAIRKELAGVPLNEHRFTDIKGGIYSDDFTEKTYRTLLTRAVSLIASGRPCILDGTFLNRTFLEEAVKRANEAGLMQGLFHIIECVCGTDIALERIAGRLEGRTPETGAVSDARREVYLMQKKMLSLERIPVPHMTIDTGKPRDENVLAAADEIFG